MTKCILETNKQCKIKNKTEKVTWAMRERVLQEDDACRSFAELASPVPVASTVHSNKQRARLVLERQQ